MESVRTVFVRLAAAAAIGVILYFLVAALGTKFGLLDWRVGFGQMTFTWGAWVLQGAAGLCLLALGLALFVTPRKGIATALVALLVPALGLGYGVYARAQAQKVPPIHDISTHRFDPPAFSAETVAAREASGAANGLDYADKRVPDNPRFGPAAGKSSMELQAAAYPDIATIRVEGAPEAVFAAARTAAESQGWTIGRVDPAAGVIEATAESFWFGFIDDIAIRVRPAPGGTGVDVDVRSVSRVGISDLGANAARIRKFERAFAAAYRS